MFSLFSQYLPNIFQQKDLFQTFYPLVVCIVISMLGSENISIYWKAILLVWLSMLHPICVRLEAASICLINFLLVILHNPGVLIRKVLISFYEEGITAHLTDYKFAN